MIKPQLPNQALEILDSLLVSLETYTFFSVLSSQSDLYFTIVLHNFGQLPGRFCWIDFVLIDWFIGLISMKPISPSTPDPPQLHKPHPLFEFLGGTLSINTSTQIHTYYLYKYTSSQNSPKQTQSGPCQITCVKAAPHMHHESAASAAISIHWSVTKMPLTRLPVSVTMPQPDGGLLLLFLLVMTAASMPVVQDKRDGGKKLFLTMVKLPLFYCWFMTDPFLATC